MKFIRFKFLAALLMCAALITLALPVPAQSTAPTLGESAGPMSTTVTPVASVTVTNAQTLTVTSNSFAIPKGGGVGIYINALGTNANSANLIAALRLSYNATNWSTTTISLTNVMNGTTATRSYHAITPDQTRGANYGSILTLANEHTNAVTASVVINR